MKYEYFGVILAFFSHFLLIGDTHSNRAALTAQELESMASRLESFDLMREVTSELIRAINQHKRQIDYFEGYFEQQNNEADQFKSQCVVDLPDRAQQCSEVIEMFKNAQDIKKAFLKKIMDEFVTAQKKYDPSLQNREQAEKTREENDQKLVDEFATIANWSEKKMKEMERTLEQFDHREVVQSQLWKAYTDNLNDSTCQQIMKHYETMIKSIQSSCPHKKFGLMRCANLQSQLATIGLSISKECYQISQSVLSPR